MKRSILVLALAVLCFVSVPAQRPFSARATASGGPLRFEEAVYDVQSYKVAVKADPATRSITGTTVMTANIVIPSNVIELDLDTPYTVSSVTDGKTPLKYERDDDTIRIWFPFTKQAGDSITTSITYSGTPRVAPDPPWVGGFMWAKTPNGADWISVALQNDGADLLFPVKDHPSDKAKRVEMELTVPDPLVAVGPGKFVRSKKNSDKTTTYYWLMTNPISNYSIVFNAAPYKEVRDTVKSITGEKIPMVFYVLPEHEGKAAGLIAETKKYNAFYEKYLGPYPFRSQKLGIVETPHLGMEHSTAIAYGNEFKYNPDGTDWLMLHEFGHEWWANLVTASDWRDFWIHEGFQTYMDTLYTGELHGKQAYIDAMKERVKTIRNRQAIAPREPMITYQVYMIAPDYVQSDGDIYFKGALVLHTLRYLIGDDAFFRALHRMAYPTKEMERLTDGRQTRLVTTDDFVTIAEQESGMDLDWFFELYARQPKLPKLIQETKYSGDTNGFYLKLHWETPNNMPFPMPIDVVIDGKKTRLEMKDGQNSIMPWSKDKILEVDPDGWVLKAQ